MQLRTLWVLFLLFLWTHSENITGATTNLLKWKELDLQIEDDLPCSFDVIIKFNKKYYAFASIQGSGEGIGVPYWAIRSSDGEHWNAINDAVFGNKNDITIDSAIVWTNYENKTHLYIAARNKVTGVNVYRTLDGKNWEYVIQNGLNSKNNDRINVMVPCNGKLHMITENDIDNGGAGSCFFVSDTGNNGDWKVILMDDSMRSPGALVGANLKHITRDGTEQEFFYFVSGNTLIWRTNDGEKWQRVPFNIWENGYGVELINFDGYVYMATFDEFDAEYMTKLFRTNDPMSLEWEELDLGVSGEELITTFGRKSLNNAKYLWFGSYPSGYMFRIGQDTNQVELVSKPRLGFKYGPRFPIQIIFTSTGLSVYDGTRVFWQKD